MSPNSMEVDLAAMEASRVLYIASKLIPMAIKLHPSQTEKLQRYHLEISKANCVVDLIHDQEELQTLGVVAGIKMVQNHGEILKCDLQDLDNNKDGHQLEKVVGNLKSERKRLIQQIRITGVGLAKADGIFTVDTKVIKTTDEAVKTAFGNELGLDIALFLARLKRVPDVKGKIRLTESEYEELTWRQIRTIHPETKTLSNGVKTRILCNCLARDQSIQILGPVAVDLWESIAFVKIEGLVAMDQAIQFGYPVTLEVFQEGLNRQEKRINASRAMRQ